MYVKLIIKNAKRSVKDYLIYIVTMTICVTLFYAFLSISSSYYRPDIGSEYDFTLPGKAMKPAICLITLCLLFLIRFVNSYMLQRRQKEFAVQSIMGMEQKTTAWLFFAETLIMEILSIISGIFRRVFFTVYYGNAAGFLWKRLSVILDTVSGYSFFDGLFFCSEFSRCRAAEHPYHSEHENYRYAFRRQKK